VIFLELLSSNTATVNLDPSRGGPSYLLPRYGHSMAYFSKKETVYFFFGADLNTNRISAPSATFVSMKL
jgi:hypothetical protein